MPAPDPAGVFASDAHRRVLGHAPLPEEDRQPEDWLAARMQVDTETLLTDQDVSEIIQDLEADGYLSVTKSGLQMTKKGFDTLTGGTS